MKIKGVVKVGTQLFASISILLVPLLSNAFETFVLDQKSNFLSLKEIFLVNLVSERGTEQIHVFFK